MKKNKSIDDIYGFIAAMRTMIDNYPELKRNDNLLNLLNSNSPIAFLLNLAEICGLSKEDLLNWVSKLLCGAEVLVSKGMEKIEDGISSMPLKHNENGVLDHIEYVVKTILLINVKNMFTCSINPFIPKNVIKYPEPNPDDETFTDGEGIKIPISTIDLFNTLQHHPNSKSGKNLYFDNEMSSNEYWKSLDFNVFLWYTINKGTNLGDEKLKKIWDNRLKYKDRINNEIFRKNYFNILKGNNSYISTNSGETITEFTRNEKKDDTKRKDKNKILKKQYIIVDFAENDPTLTVPNTLTIWLNGDRYRKKVKSFYINKTVFEFNYEYIFSLKLFDSKTIVANVLNAMLGLTRSAAASVLDGKYSLEQNIIAGRVGEIVKEVLSDNDTTINDCFFSFSNDQYNDLVNEAEKKYNQNYQFGDINGQLSQEDIDEINENITNISDSATLNEKQTNIKNLFTNAASVTAAKSDEISLNDKFTFGENIILDLLKESVTQIVLQVLSPKVMVLYALNSYFMGDITDGDFSKINIDSFLKSLNNLIVSIVKEVLNIIINELLKDLLQKLKEILNLFLRKIILERIEYYLEIIRRLLALIEMFYNAINNKKATDFIDNVNYPDIVKTENKPKEQTC